MRNFHAAFRDVRSHLRVQIELVSQSLSLEALPDVYFCYGLVVISPSNTEQVQVYPSPKPHGSGQPPPFSKTTGPQSWEHVIVQTATYCDGGRRVIMPIHGSR